ncbi:hypothetical protein H5T51_04860 [Candidatus Bathyarchaeota archaeon]|nr:hypothetical protein [Candidatus Bathyarchaeota archaeon]
MKNAMENNAKHRIYSECFKIIKESLKSQRMVVVCDVLKARLPYYLWVGFYIPKGEVAITQII